MKADEARAVNGRSGEMKTDQPFIDHIAAHLDRGDYVICKICGRTAASIVAEHYKNNPPVAVPSAEALDAAYDVLVREALECEQGAKWAEDEGDEEDADDFTRESKHLNGVAEFLRAAKP